MDLDKASLVACSEVQRRQKHMYAGKPCCVLAPTLLKPFSTT